MLHSLIGALRAVWRSRSVSVVVIALLALGIGVNVAVFSVVNAVLLKPIPFQDPDSLVLLANSRNGALADFTVSAPKFTHVRAQTDVFEEVAAVRSYSLNYSAGDVLEQVSANQVTESYFRVYRVSIIRGRPFTIEEDLPGGSKVAVISYRFWHRSFAADEAVLGKSLSLSGEVYTIVGVSGPDFDPRDVGGAPDLWVPFQLDPGSTDHGNYFSVAARLKPDIGLEQAKARIDASAEAFRQRFPDAMSEDASLTLVGLQEAIVPGDVRTRLLILLGAVTFVLLIACANVANLLLMRARTRAQEIALRRTLGAGRRRIVSQLLTESVVMALSGGLCGLVIGYVGMRVLLQVNTAGLPRLGTDGSLMGLDWRIAVFALALSIASGIVFGLAPALAGSRQELNSAIKVGRSDSGSQQSKRRSMLVMAEVALTVVLLIGAGLLIRTSIALGSVDPGFDTSNVITMRTSLSGSPFETSRDVERVVTQGLDRVRALPGVVTAAAGCCVPLQGGLRHTFNIVGRPIESGTFTGSARFETTSTGYFSTFGIPVIRGRDFVEGDDSSGPPVAVINQAMAEQYWREGLDPLSDRILIGGGIVEALQGEPVRQIVGIVGDVRAAGLGAGPPPTLYVPQAQIPDVQTARIMSIAPLAWVVRTQGNSAALTAAIGEEIRQATGLPVTSIQPMREVVTVSTSRQRLNMLLMTIFGACALVIAAVGIYASMAYSVQQRTRSIAIRFALGAPPSGMKRMVVGHGLLLTAIGISAGVVASYAAADMLASFLFEVQPRDPIVFTAVPVVLLGVALAASWLPARRATRVDMRDVLRYE